MDNLTAIRRQVRLALGHMTRHPAVRRVRSKPVLITPAMKTQIRLLARTTDMTAHQIANRVGVRNSGRVSEVLNGRR